MYTEPVDAVSEPARCAQRFPRFERHWPVQWTDPDSGKAGRGQSFDFSAAGIGIASMTPVPEGTRLALAIDMGSDGHATANGRVAWCRYTQEGAYRFGVELDNYEVAN